MAKNENRPDFNSSEMNLQHAENEKYMIKNENR
jgi:hypothetical protein